jgi:hypothetical protein
MVSSGMLRRVALLRTDVSAELITSVIREKAISELRTALAVPNTKATSSLIHTTLMMEAIVSSEESVLARATRRHLIIHVALWGMSLFVCQTLPVSHV